MRAALASGAVISRTTPVLTFSPGVREQAESRAAPAASAPRALPPPPVPRPARSNLPIVPRIVRRSPMGVDSLIAPLARAAATSGGRTMGKLLVIAVALAALGLFAGLNMRALTGDVDPSTATARAAAPTRASDATASERVQARGTMAPRREAPPSR